MHKNNIPLKVALGYSAIAIIMILAISLVYSNTKSINAINEASREYIQKRGAADSTISSLLKEEQRNLKQLSDVMAGRPTQNYLQNKVKNLNTGKDSILVHSKAPQTHEAKKTTVEVLKTRRGILPPTRRCLQEGARRNLERKTGQQPGCHRFCYHPSKRGGKRGKHPRTDRQEGESGNARPQAEHQ